jgi:hypothetical protein
MTDLRRSRPLTHDARPFFVSKISPPEAKGCAPTIASKASGGA